MRFIIREIPLFLEEEEKELEGKVAKKAGISRQEITGIRVLRKSIDARKKQKICFRYTLEIDVADPAAQRFLLNKGIEKAELWKKEEVKRGTRPVRGRIVVVGAGPCGLFCAYELARHGLKPILLERGREVDQRSRDFEALCKQGTLDPQSNVCFGEGGAGAFSDGKLTTRIKDGRTREVLETLVACGAPEEILIQAKPHMGTEHIRAAVKQLRKKIILLGGEVRFQSKLCGICSQNGALDAIYYEQDGKRERIETNCMVLAIGHSARDTFEMLEREQIAMQAKPFAIGVRIEHKRAWIDRAQYGKYAADPRLGAAEYRLSTKYGTRGVYTFCMCPGGQVVCSASEEGHVAVNGMSYYARAAQNSNSAVVVTVTPEDFGNRALDGIRFQRKYEALAYRMAGGYGAPVQTLGDFLEKKKTALLGEIQPSYQPYTVAENLWECLPEFVGQGLAQGFGAFDHMFPGFGSRQAVLTGIETRTSSPVRILRDEMLQSLSIKGCYPAGEGAGYAGGIVSAAVDGLKVAQEILKQFGGGDA